VRGLTVSSTATLSLVFGVGLIFYFVPTAKVRFRDVWVGATLTGLLWRVAFAGFAWWVRDMSRYSIHRVDWRRCGLPCLDLHLVGDPAVRRRVHRRIQPPAARARRGGACDAATRLVTSRHRRALILSAAIALRPAAVAAALVLISVPEEITMGRQAQAAMAARTPRIASANSGGQSDRPSARRGGQPAARGFPTRSTSPTLPT
jgi:hypothetical protein